jgi:hypothetical protein
MGDVLKPEPNVLALESRTAWAKRILLHQNLPVCLATVRRSFYPYLLSPLSLPFLHFINEPRDSLGLIELDYYPLRHIRATADPAGSSESAMAV